MSKANSIPTQPRWFKTDKVKQTGIIKTDVENGIIHDIVLCQAGEARGHGIFLEQEFIEKLVELGSKVGDAGLKSRFGHPAMCNTALGTYMGRIQNIRALGDKAIGDLHLDDASKISPTHGNMYNYVLTLAKNSPDMCGFSIVFVPGESYLKDKEGNKIPLYTGSDDDDDFSYNIGQSVDGKVYATIETLMGCDLEDEGAATPAGMFSAAAEFNADKLGVQVDALLNEYPSLAEFISKNPEKVQEFMNKKFFKKDKPTMTKPSAPKKTGLLSAIISVVKSFSVEGSTSSEKLGINATTDKGVNIVIDTQEAKPAVGDPVLNEDGTPATAGDHVIVGGDLDGYTITVGNEGTITAINEPTTAENPDAAPADAELKKENEQLRSGMAEIEKRLSAIEKINSEKDAEIARLKKELEEPATDHSKVGAQNDTVNGGKKFGSDVWDKPWNQRAKEYMG